MRRTLGLPQPWLRLLIVGGGLMFVAALAFVASRRELALVLIMPFGIGMVLALLRWPALGSILAAVSGLLVPYAGPSGLNVTMMLVALSLGLWLLDMFIRNRQIQLVPSRTIWPLLAFLLVASISFGIGQLPWFTFALHAPLGAQLGGMSIIVLSAATFLLVANQVQDLRWLRRLTWAFLAVGTVSILVRYVLPILGVATQEFLPRVGTMFFVCIVGVAFSQAIFNNELHRGWRWALAGLVVVMFYVLFIVKFDDKAGWVSAFVCIGAIIGLRSWRLALALVPLAVIPIYLQWTRFVGVDEYSITTRFDAWIIMARIIKISPIMGLGFANYYWYTPLFPIRGYAVSFNSHNNFIDILAETGLVGLVCLLWFLGEVGWLGWKLRDRVPAGFARAYVYGAFGILAGMVVAAMLGDWVLPFFYNIGLLGFRSSMLGWLFIGGLVSIEQMVAKRRFLTADR